MLQFIRYIIPSTNTLNFAQHPVKRHSRFTFLPRPAKWLARSILYSLYYIVYIIQTIYVSVIILVSPHINDGILSAWKFCAEEIFSFIRNHIGESLMNQNRWKMFGQIIDIFFYKLYRSKPIFYTEFSRYIFEVYDTPCVFYTVYLVFGKLS